MAAVQVGSSNNTATTSLRASPKDTQQGAQDNLKKEATSDKAEFPRPAPRSERTIDQKTTNAPLPRPTQPDPQNSYGIEPNPFEQSFGQPSDDPRRGFGHALPSVSSLTSPAPLGPGATPDWQNSLRTGPLSPAMLTGPTGVNGGDYFDSTFRQSFPTPNESSMRSTGLTPGGQSMFPAPSPNSQAIFNSMQTGGATPGTLDFHRTAMNAKARTVSEQHIPAPAPSQGVNKSDYQPATQQQQMPQTTFNNNSESDAVNSLYMLANNGQRNPNQFSMPQNPAVAQMRASNGQSRPIQEQQTPTAHRAQHQSIGGMSASTASGIDGYGSDGSQDTKPSGKKGGGKKGGKGAASNGRRKTDDSIGKGPPSKKSKGNNGDAQMTMDMMMDDEEEEDDIDRDNEVGPNGKKLTDEEKRKNFLERNRVAALKCRQRKKQWLANLQAKVEIFTTENDALTNQCAQLREENQNLKALLVQHKDCAVSHSQGLGGARMIQVLGTEFGDGPNSQYGMGMNGSNNPNIMMGGTHQR